jgi:plasmid stability protein
VFDSPAGTGKLTVRSLAPDVFAALTELAQQHDRSLEAEARQAIRAWVQPQLARASATRRADLVGQRLSYLLAEAQQVARGRPPTVSKIAAAAGYTHASDLEDWFAGDVEPSFGDLTRLAALFGCAADWLLHGEGTPYNPLPQRIPENPTQAVQVLLTPVTAGGRPPEIHLLRSTAPEGDFAFIRREGEFSAQTFRTPYRLSEDVGGGGQISQAWLALGLQALYRAYSERSEVDVKGYLVEPAAFSELLEGRRHPLNVLADARVATSTWWEDIGDPTQRGRNRYWDGWDDLISRIDRHIDGNRAMAAARAQLQSIEN